VKWSFPRKVKLPFTNKGDISRWRGSHIPQFAFAIDQKDIFWVIAQGYLFCSEDANQWIQVELLKTNPEKKPENMWHASYFLTHDQSDRLILLNNFFKYIRQKENPSNVESEYGIGLWSRDSSGRWNNQEFINEGYITTFSITEINSHRLVATFGTSKVSLRTYDKGQGWSENILIEGYLKDPMHPSVAALPNGQIVVAYSCKEGIVTKLVNLDDSND